jgi:hypothetical protein
VTPDRIIATVLPLLNSEPAATAFPVIAAGGARAIDAKRDQTFSGCALQSLSDSLAKSTQGVRTLPNGWTRR